MIVMISLLLLFGEGDDFVSSVLLLLFEMFVVDEEEDVVCATTENSCRTLSSSSFVQYGGRGSRPAILSVLKVTLPFNIKRLENVVVYRFNSRRE